MPYEADSDVDLSRHGVRYTLSSIDDQQSLSLNGHFDQMHMEHGLGRQEGRSGSLPADFLDEELYHKPSGGDGVEKMEVDLPQPGPSHPFQNRQSLANANSSRTTQAAVVHHSRPKKDRGKFAMPPKHHLLDDQDELITSDVTPRVAKKAAVVGSALKTSVLPSDFSSQPAPSALPVPTDASAPKRRGRPAGWRPGSGPYSALSETAGSSTRRPKPKKPTSEVKRRGRPPKNPPLTPRQIYLKLTPKFIPFNCEWEGCPAELQNLDTLRRHLLIVHGKSATCKWANCAAKHGAPVDFATRGAFEAHIESAHLVPYAWHLGDGPHNNSGHPPDPSAVPPINPSFVASTKGRGGNGKGKDKERDDTLPLPAYLFDAHGNQVTPSLHNQQLETDEERRKRRQRLARLNQQRNNNAPEEPIRTQEEVDAMSAALDTKKARQKMFRDYRMAVCGGGDGRPPKYGKEWRGNMMPDTHVEEE
ncbi:hypothetical protein B0T25DRAFT_317526 [Lasiosphaeria hispida]|uniref:C2H2-type domain-containing protein n=1 Tax=Lasiosphaeria hispida TaxID=260671 RepID=A0AAJ0H952_9PEZI|nr:hypothetical protein B0T25DRAFT_317526 [Lasiosphaeria hispida]